jgi:hypothetical protein
MLYDQAELVELRQLQQAESIRHNRDIRLRNNKATEFNSNDWLELCSLRLFPTDTRGQHLAFKMLLDKREGTNFLTMEEAAELKAKLEFKSYPRGQELARKEYLSALRNDTKLTEAEKTELDDLREQRYRAWFFKDYC